MTTGTTDGVAGRARVGSPVSLLEVIRVVAVAGLTLAFVVLPWFIDGAASVTGLMALLSGTGSLGAEADAALAPIAWALPLLPVAIALTITGLYLGITRQVTDWRAWLLPAGGLVGLAYPVLFLAEHRGSGATLMQYTGIGFWIACFASGFLLLQHFAVRTPATTHAAPVHAGPLTRLRHRLSSLLDGPRAQQFIGTIFRFQFLFGLVIVIVLAIAFSPVRNDTNLFLSQRNLSNVTRDVSETGILAVGMLLVIIIGGIDLSVGSVVALAATGGAYLLMRDHVPAYAAIGLILSMGLAIGWFNGWVSERFRVPAFVTTLAMLSIARGLAVIWSNRIAVPLSYGEGGADPAFEAIGNRIDGVVPVPAIIMLVVALVMAAILRYSPFGRYLYAIGGNETAARLSGVAVSRVKITAFMLCTFFAALTGIVHAAQLDQGSPNEAVGYELNAIAAVVIGGASLAGGKGTIAGAIAGAFILGILDNMLSLNNVDSAAQLVIKGLIVIGAVAIQQVRVSGTAT